MEFASGIFLIGLILLFLLAIAFVSGLGVVAFAMTLFAKSRRTAIAGISLGLVAVAFVLLCRRALLANHGGMSAFEEVGLSISFWFGLLACIWGFVRVRRLPRSGITPQATRLFDFNRHL